jgi:hypothetical protein
MCARPFDDPELVLQGRVVPEDVDASALVDHRPQSVRVKAQFVGLPEIRGVGQQEEHGLDVGVGARRHGQTQPIPQEIGPSSEVRLGLDLILGVVGAGPLDPPHGVGVGEK